MKNERVEFEQRAVTSEMPQGCVYIWKKGLLQTSSLANITYSNPATEKFKRGKKETLYSMQSADSLLKKVMKDLLPYSSNYPGRYDTEFYETVDVHCERHRTNFKLSPWSILQSVAKINAMTFGGELSTDSTS